MFVKGAPVNSFWAVAVCRTGRCIDGLQVDFLLDVGLGMPSGREGERKGGKDEGRKKWVVGTPPVTR